MTQKHNPKLFREMSEPFNNKEELDAALDAFSKGMQELRETCKIPNVHIAVECSYLNAEGEELVINTTATMGDSTKMLPLIAYAFGREKEAHSEMLAKLISRKR